MTSDPTVPTSLLAILISAIVALSGTVAYLFRFYSGRIDKQTKEREEWAAERQEIRAEYEAKFRQMAEDNAEAMRDLYDSARMAEHAIRREYTNSMEVVAGKATEAVDRVAVVIDKLYERYSTSPRRVSKG